MSFDLGAIRDSIRSGLTPIGINVYASVATVDVPFAIVGSPSEVRYVTTYGGSAEVDLDVTVVVARADDDNAQDRIDAALSTGTSGSIFDTLRELAEGDSVYWRSLSCTRAGAPYAVQVGNAACVAVDFQLKIKTR